MSNEETVNQEPLDEAALNEEASRELAAMVAEAEQTPGAAEEDADDDAPLSAPQIAGAVALLRQAFPNLTAAETVDLLLRTARDAGAAGIDATYGRGVLDIGRAFAPQGTTTLAGSNVAMAPAATSMVTSAAMGDAALRGASVSAIMLDGAASQVSEDNGDADTTIKVSWEDWQAMAAGQLDGMTAFMTGKLKVEGDMGNAMQLQGVLAKLR